MDTYTASAQPDERSRKNLAAMLHALARLGQERVAEAIGKDNTTVSRMKDTQFPAIAKLVSALGLKVVPIGYRCVDADTYKTMKRLAIERLQDEDDAPRLEWE